MILQKCLSLYPMKTQETITEERLKIIVNDDVTIIDILADMTDRRLLKQLQTFINYGNHQPNFILHKGITGYTLLLYKAPFGMNIGDNKLTLFFHHNLTVMCDYFKRWRDMEAGAENHQKDLLKALIEITNLLYYYRINDNEDVQSDFIG